MLCSRAILTLNTHVFLSVCLSVCLFICLSVSQSVCLYVCQSVCLSVCLSVSLSVSQSVAASGSVALCWEVNGVLEMVGLKIHTSERLWPVYEASVYIYHFHRSSYIDACLIRIANKLF